MEPLRQFFCVSRDIWCARVAQVFVALYVMVIVSVIPVIFLATGAVYLARAHDTRTPLVTTYTASLDAWDGGGSQEFVADTRIGGYLTLFVFLYSNGRSFRYQQDLVPSTERNPFGLQEGRDVNGGAPLPEQRTTGLYATPQIPPTRFSLPENVGHDALVSFSIVHWLPGRDFFFTLFASDAVLLWQSVTYAADDYGSCNLGGTYAPGFSADSNSPMCRATFQASGACVAVGYRPNDGNLSTWISGCTLSSPGDEQLRRQRSYTALAYGVSGTTLPIAAGTPLYFSATVSVLRIISHQMLGYSAFILVHRTCTLPPPPCHSRHRYAQSLTPLCSCSF